MKCPYNFKCETQVQKWKQSPDENQILKNGTTVTQTVYELMDCMKEECGAWHDGKCCYAPIRQGN